MKARLSTLPEGDFLAVVESDGCRFTGVGFTEREAVENLREEFELAVRRGAAAMKLRYRVIEYSIGIEEKT